jgi:hypothetical protein
MSRTNFLGYSKKPSNPPSLQVDGKAVIADTLTVDDVDMGESISTLETKVAALEDGKSGSIVDGDFPEDPETTSQITYFESDPESTGNALISSTYQIVGTRITVYGYVEVVFYTGMNYATSLIPYPVIDGKTYAFNTSLPAYDSKITVVGGHIVNNNAWIFPEYVQDHDGTTFELGWTKPDYSVWGVTTGSTVFFPFSVTYNYVAVEP